MCPLHPCMRLLCPSLAWRLSLLLLIGLSGCGPAPSDPAPNLESRASGAGPSELPTLAPKNPSPPPAPLAAPLTTNHVSPSAAQKAEPAPLPEQLVLPQWIVQALASPEVPVRLRALDLWAQQGPEAPLDPLVVALDDKDETVRAKAMAMIERHWAVEQEAEP